jgi:hypothetical protein
MFRQPVGKPRNLVAERVFLRESETLSAEVAAGACGRAIGLIGRSAGPLRNI